MTHYCCVPACPGLPWRASERPHTCGSRTLGPIGQGWTPNERAIEDGTRTFRVDDEEHPGSTLVVTWAELAEANDADTMEEIARLEVGERTVLGQCDPIERVS